MKLRYEPLIINKRRKHQVKGYTYYLPDKGLADNIFRITEGNKQKIISELKKARKEYGLNIGQINELSKLMKLRHPGIIDERMMFHKI